MVIISQATVSVNTLLAVTVRTVRWKFFYAVQRKELISIDTLLGS